MCKIILLTILLRFLSIGSSLSEKPGLIKILLLPYNHSCMQLSGAVLYFFVNYMDIALQIFPNLSKIVPNSVPLTLYYYVI